jgi:DNA polymerase-3 subunit alpha
VGRNRSRYAILTLSDPSGMVEAWMFSEVLAQSRELLDAGGPLLVVCDARADGDSVRVTVQSAQALDEVAADAQTGLAVWVRDTAALPRIRTVLERERRGRGRVNLILRIDGDTEVELALPARVALSPDARAALRSLPGVMEVRDL